MSAAPSTVRGGDRDDDARSELGGLFEQASTMESRGEPRSGGGVRIPPEGIARRAPATARAAGRGPVPTDPRKYKYDRTRGRTMVPLAFGATRADRMDAAEAGEMLTAIHEMYGIDRESEDVLLAFDKALFFEHTVNGASLLQEGRGVLTVGESTFDLSMVKTKLGKDQRRFFRAYADDIADVNREVLASYDPYDPAAAEKHGQLMQVAVDRGLQKAPYLAHDSADAGVRLSVEERLALMASRRAVLPYTVNNADKIPERVAAAGSVIANAGGGSDY